MNGCLGGCLGRVLGLVLLAVVLVAAWRFGPDLIDRLPEWTGAEPTEASPEMADRALERYGALDSGAETQVSFSALELESILRYRLSDHFPPGIGHPSIRIEGGEVRARLDVALDLLPRIPELDGLRDVLPDPVSVDVRGHVLTLEGGRPAFLVRRIDVQGIPVPRRFHAEIAEALDPLSRTDIPAEAIALPLPEGVREMRVEGEELLVRGAA